MFEGHEKEILLVKVGGGGSLNWEGVCSDLGTLFPNTPVVLVHGANALRDELAVRLGVPVRTVESPSGVSSVYTDETARDVLLMAYPGLANTRIVALLQRYGVNAVGLSGVDGRLWRARPKKEIQVRENGKIKILRGNLTGTVEEVDPFLPRLLLRNGYLPVLCPPALSFDNEIVSADNDWAAAVLAEALKVKRMIFLFEAPGLLADPDDETSLIPFVRKEQLMDIMDFGKGRMKKKILGTRRAFEGGVESVIWSDGRVDRPLHAALDGGGTILR